MKVINCKKYHMKKFTEIKTQWGENFVSFHHRLFDLYGKNAQRFDISQWRYVKDQKAQDYYLYLLALFISPKFLLKKQELLEII